MKAGDLVRIKQRPPGSIALHGFEPGTICIIVGSDTQKSIDPLSHEQWLQVLRTDTGKIQRFHESWCEAINESR